MDSFNKSICIYISYLRALYFIHQQHHWTAAGTAYFAHHKMFEMLYESAKDSADQAAEKFVGLFGDECLDLDTQNEYIHKILSVLSKEEDHVKRSLHLEEKFLEYSETFYNGLKKDYPEKMSLGLDDMLMSICNDRESACYHLRRTLKD